MPRVDAVYADNPILTAAQKKRMVKAKPKKARCGCGKTDAGYTICGCVVPNPISRAYWTAAPKSYDYGYTVDTGRKSKSVTGATWRLVTTTDEVRFQSHQIPRYQSGMKGIVVANSSDAMKLGLPDVKSNPSKGPKIKAISFERYNGGAAVKRRWGSSTVTKFYVSVDGVPGSQRIIEGYGKTPGSRKTYAKEKFLQTYKQNPCGCGIKNNPVGPARRMSRAQLEKLVWGKTPRDYRGIVKRKRSILVLTKQGTSLVPLSSIGMDQLRQLAGVKQNPTSTCKYQENPTKIAIRSITVSAPWMRRTVRGGKNVWANADSAAKAVCKSKPNTAAKRATMDVTYRYANGEQVVWKLAAGCSREKLSTRVKKTLLPAAGFDFPSRGKKPTGKARQAFLDLLAYYDTGAPIRAPWDK